MHIIILLLACEKKGIIQKEGLTLIIVPCWWDGSIASLQATINFQRPDLFPRPEIDPIPLNPPLNFFSVKDIPDVGELMLASFPTSTKFTNSIHAKNWWMGEKYDGVRFCWHPQQSKIYTRNGTVVYLLPSLLNFMPKVFIDAEFWFGRGNFNNTHMLCESNIELVYWDSLRLVSFDVASPILNNTPFEKRYHSLLDSVAYDNPVVVVAPRLECLGKKHLNDSVEKIIENGGEGIIIRKMGSLYEHGRSLSLFKFKAAHADKEGLVIDVDNNSVTLKLPNGQIFGVPIEQVNIPEPVKRGEIVTFEYEINSRRDLPVNPCITRVRHDISWEQLLASHERESHLIGASSKGLTTHPSGYWTHMTMRQFMIDLALSFSHSLSSSLSSSSSSSLSSSSSSISSSSTNSPSLVQPLDPLQADTWRLIPFRTVQQSKGGRVILQKHGGYLKALKALFPDMVGLDDNFLQPIWSSVENRRKFFEDFASKSGFDYKSPSNWYSQRPDQILSTKGANNMLFYHNYSVSKALLDLFPDIGLDSSKLGRWTWQYTSSRRNFFENYADFNNFDPTIAANWYNQHPDDLLSFEGALSVIQYHNNSISQALIELFPDIHFDKYLLQIAFDKQHIITGKDVLKKFAKEHSFDKLSAENWYLICRKKIFPMEELNKVLNRPFKNLIEALLDLVPNVGWKVLSFNKTPLHKAESRRNFLENFAELNSFDALVASNWYLQSTEQIMQIEGSVIMLSHHENSIPQALIDLFPEISFNKSALKHNFEWKYSSTRRKLFEKFAIENQFDALVNENWYSHMRNLKSFEGVSSVISYHNFSLVQALIELFPEIGLDPSRFAPSKWDVEDNRRRFFIRYAQSNGFDYEIPENWYIQSKEKIMAAKGASKVILHHNNNIATALIQLFPNISFKNELFWQTGAKYSLKFFERYAKDHGFDPLVAENWYIQSRWHILSTKGASTVVSQYGSLTKALLSFFPNIGIVKSKLWLYGWNDSNNRRNFFEEYAQEHSFDPLIAGNWYSVNEETILSKKNARDVIHYHKDDVGQALVDLFPEINLDKSKFSFHKIAWSDPSVRRNYFENYAKEHGFDPLNAEDWYSHPIEKISSAKGALKVLSFHKGKVSNALSDLFSDIGLDKTKFWSRVLYNDEEKRRNFFENYAASNGFDPLVASNWYYHKNKLLTVKGAGRVIGYHQNNLSKTLIDLFPDIGLDPSQLRTGPVWPSKNKRREFFEKYANESGFDALNPECWYSQSKLRIVSKGGFMVMSYYKGNVEKALLDLFPEIGLDPTKF